MSVEKSLVTFVFHKRDVNVDFFMRHGIVSSPNVDYCIVENSDVLAPGVVESMHGASKVYSITRHNVSQCFGGYSASVRMLTYPYKYRFFINSTVRGPFVPPYASKSKHWTEYFVEKFVNNVVMVGATINLVPYVHVQSMMMAVDQRALKILVDNNILLKEDVMVEKEALIANHEIRGPQLVLKSGYNLDCMMTSYQGRDWRTTFTEADDLLQDPWYVGAYYGHTLHPYETMFFKCFRSDILEHTPINLLTDLINRQQSAVLQFEASTDGKKSIDQFIEENHKNSLEQKLSDVSSSGPTRGSMTKHSSALDLSLLLSTIACVLGLVFLVIGSILLIRRR